MDQMSLADRIRMMQGTDTSSGSGTTVNEEFGNVVYYPQAINRTPRMKFNIGNSESVRVSEILAHMGVPENDYSTLRVSIFGGVRNDQVLSPSSTLMAGEKISVSRIVKAA